MDAGTAFRGDAEGGEGDVEGGLLRGQDPVAQGGRRHAGADSGSVGRNKDGLKIRLKCFKRKTIQPSKKFEKKRRKHE